jgi:hypothetical protein
MAGGMLVAVLGMPPVLGQEQPQGQGEKAQAAEEIRLTRAMLNLELAGYGLRTVRRPPDDRRVLRRKGADCGHNTAGAG